MCADNKAPVATCSDCGKEIPQEDEKVGMCAECFIAAYMEEE